MNPIALTVAEQNARRREIARVNGLPAPRELSMCLYAAGMVRPRVAPEVDLSPLPWMLDTWHHAAYFDPGCMEHLEAALKRNAARIITPENDFDAMARSFGGIILPGARA